MNRDWRGWLHPDPAAIPWMRAIAPEPVTDSRQRKALAAELVIVLAVTLGLSGLQSLLSLVEALLKPEPLAQQKVAINAPGAELSWLDLAMQLTHVGKLCAWGALGLVLLWRSGIPLRLLGVDRSQLGSDVRSGIALAAVIGIPGLGFYLLMHAVGLNLEVQPSTLGETWWRIPVLVAAALGNAIAEEVLVVAYALVRLRQLGWGANRALWISAILRGSYHLYQGFGGFLGNVVMGLVYGRVWQRSGRIWPLVLGHALIDVVAFAGYAIVAP